jgi:hypothetical protein
MKYDDIYYKKVLLELDGAWHSLVSHIWLQLYLYYITCPICHIQIPREIKAKVLALRARGTKACNIHQNFNIRSQNVSYIVMVFTVMVSAKSMWWNMCIWVHISSYFPKESLNSDISKHQSMIHTPTSSDTTYGIRCNGPTVIPQSLTQQNYIFLFAHVCIHSLKF